MPTARAYWFTGAAILLYLFANQTQIGWLYVMSALLIGVIFASFLLNHRALRGVEGKRYLDGSSYSEVHEGEELNVELILQSNRGTPAVQLQVDEVCPIADPEKRITPIFVPLLPAHGSIQFDYHIEVDRRGVYDFPAVKMASRAPFGFFQRKTEQIISTQVLVLPEVRPLNKFSLFDRQIAAQMVYPRSGIGSEVIGVRPYRPGDSPRHVHWRSVARTGQLISKEFAEETRPGLTLVFDRFYPGDYETKHNPFEWAVKTGVSIADYARKRGYPLYLLADTADLPTPSGAVAWDALLQYMTRVNPMDRATLPDLLTGHGLQSFVVVIIPWPESAIIEPLMALKHRGYNILPVLMNPGSFLKNENDIAPIFKALAHNRLDAVKIDYGLDWTVQLAEPVQSR